MRQLSIILALVFFISCKNNFDTSKQLSDRIENLGNDYLELMSSFEQKYVINEFKSRPFYEKAKYIHKSTEELLEGISISEKIDRKLFEQIENCFQNIQTFYWANEESQLNSMNEKLNFFKSQYPLNQNLDTITKLFFKLDLSLIRLQVIRHLYSQIDRYDYKFNFIRPIVLENKKVLKLGETYKAKIMLSAVDTTNPPQFFVFGEEIESYDGYGNLNITTHKKGEFEWTGIVKLTNLETGEREEIPVSGTYEVK